MLCYFVGVGVLDDPRYHGDVTDGERNPVSSAALRISSAKPIALHALGASLNPERSTKVRGRTPKSQTTPENLFSLVELMQRA